MPPGRPRRDDWRNPHSLDREEPGRWLLLEVSYQGRRVRAELLGHLGPARILIRDTEGDSSEIWTTQVVRYRVLTCPWQADDIVVLRGVPDDQWRGVVLAAEGDTVTVETNGDTIEEHWAEDLESAWSREQVIDALPLKRGPIANDPVVEMINSAASRRRAAGTDTLTGTDGPWAR